MMVRSSVSWQPSTADRGPKHVDNINMAYISYPLSKLGGGAASDQNQRQRDDR